MDYRLPPVRPGARQRRNKSSRYPYLAVSTAQGFGLISSLLKPTIVMPDPEDPVMQAYRPSWQIGTDLARAICGRVWHVDLCLFAVHAADANIGTGATLVLTMGPVLTAGPDITSDLLLPVPPPGILKIPLAIIPDSWTRTQQMLSAKQRVHTFLMERLQSGTRNAGRTMLRIAFQEVTLHEPDTRTLMLATCPVLDLVTDIQVFLEEVCPTQRGVGSRVARLMPTVHAI